MVGCAFWQVFNPAKLTPWANRCAADLLKLPDSVRAGPGFYAPRSVHAIGYQFHAAA